MVKRTERPVPKTEFMTMRTTRRTVRAIDKIARKQKRSRSQIMSMAIAEYLDNHVTLQGEQI